MSLRIPDDFRPGDRVIAVAGTPLRLTGMCGEVIRKNVVRGGYRIRWDIKPHAFSPDESNANGSSLRYPWWGGDARLEVSRSHQARRPFAVRDTERGQVLELYADFEAALSAVCAA